MQKVTESSGYVGFRGRGGGSVIRALGVVRGLSRLHYLCMGSKGMCIGKWDCRCPSGGAAAAVDDNWLVKARDG